MKATDTNAIPLCQHHHRELHKCGNEQTFFELMGYNRDYGKALSKRLWEIDPVHLTLEHVTLAEVAEQLDFLDDQFDVLTMCLSLDRQ